MKEITILSTEVNPAANLPFSSIENNDSFAHLLRIGNQHGISMTVSHFDSYENGNVAEVWTYNQAGWNRTGSRPVEFIWDRCNIRNKEREKLNAHPAIDVFNPAELMRICRDKKANHELTPKFTIPTETVNGSIDEIVAKIEAIRAKQLHPDLNPDRIVLKPRCNYSGHGIFDIYHEDYAKLKTIENQDFIIQPFLETSGGINQLEIGCRHDLRIIVLNGKPIIAYARLAKQGQFISGVKYGAVVKHVNISDIDDKFMDVVYQVDSKLERFNPRMYSIDLGKGRDKTWIFEFNGFPSVVWEPDDEVEIRETKKMHNRIIRTLVDYIQ
ncbi:hypothetical protein KY333_02760 [Candidatus Woesearchaeota archaeon]|nr:hypothetical protein [Candidatus Woesearchaeota archaeon]